MKIFTFLFLIILALSACKKGELKAPIIKPCIDTLVHDVISINGPTSAAVNQQITFNVSWKALNGCDNFVAFKQDTISNTFSIKTFASHDSCSVCTTPGAINKIAVYQFKTSKSGTYYLKFYRSAKDTLSAITDTLTVK